MLQPGTTDRSTTPGKYGRKFDEELNREAAALACRPGARPQQVARAPAVSLPKPRVAPEEKLHGGSIVHSTVLHLRVSPRPIPFTSGPKSANPSGG